MNVIVIAPHPDDETLGCGGTVCLHSTRREPVSTVFLTSGELGLKHLAAAEARACREREAQRAAEILGLKQTFFLRCRDWMLADEIPQAAALLAPLIEKLKPDLIYLPHQGDSHPDHRAALPILRQALQALPGAKPEVRAYEIWSPLMQWVQATDITVFMGRKLEALRAHESQLKEYDYIRAITGLNQYRGALATRTGFAEVFGQCAI